MDLAQTWHSQKEERSDQKKNFRTFVSALQKTCSIYLIEKSRPLNKFFEITYFCWKKLYLNV